MKIQVKRVYLAPEASDGLRILVDRLWPRGLTKEKARLDMWAKDLAPSTELRRWFQHDPQKWHEFQERYRQELKAKGEQLAALKEKSKGETLTLLYGARDEEHNEARVLQAILQMK